MPASSTNKRARPCESRAFLFLGRVNENDHLRGMVVFCGVFCSNFCFCSFLASVHFFCSEATPIIWRENACVNDFFMEFFISFFSNFWTLYVVFRDCSKHWADNEVILLWSRGVWLTNVTITHIKYYDRIYIVWNVRTVQAYILLWFSIRIFAAAAWPAYMKCFSSFYKKLFAEYQLGRLLPDGPCSAFRELEMHFHIQLDLPCQASEEHFDWCVWDI